MARLIHGTLLSVLFKHHDTLKPGSTSVITLGNRLLFATENHINKVLVDEMKTVLSAQLNARMAEGQEVLEHFIEEQRNKFRLSIDLFSHQFVRDTFRSAV